jgi:hypothetical protein
VVFFPSIQFFSTEAAAFVMPILFLITVNTRGTHVLLIGFDELCCFYAAAMLLV